jgi:HAE1 family hydrophobic/amphiphilic exporter-1
MGMTVFSGMLVATVIGVLIIPALYVLVSGRGGGRPDAEGPLDEKVQGNVRENVGENVGEGQQP